MLSGESARKELSEWRLDDTLGMGSVSINSDRHSRTSSTAVEALPAMIQEIYAITSRLEAMFPGRRFTPDGHLVGSIGEVLAASRYRLTLMDNMSEKGHDAIAEDGRKVQIKATQGSSVALRGEPEQLIVLHISVSGQATEIYNGPGKRPWELAGKMQRNGQRPISTARLKTLMERVVSSERIPSR